MFRKFLIVSASLLVMGVQGVRAQEPAAVSFEVDASKKKPISRFIYGWNNIGSWGGAQKYVTLNRSGGNRLTAWNWVNGMSNAGSDWHFISDGGGRGNGPGAGVRGSVDAALKAGASMLVTVPIAGYVALKPVDNALNDPDHLAKYFAVSLAKKNAPFVDNPAPDAAKVYQDEFVYWLEKQFPNARKDPTRTIFYSLDNEPDLWASTHKEIHPQKLTYEEITRLNIEYGQAIKSVAPKALVFGFVSYGYAGFTNLQGAPDAKGRPFLDYYLDELAKVEKQNHKRAVDVLDLHWYSEAHGGGKRVTDGDSPATAAARMQAPRSLWDPSYTEDSWIAKDVVRGPIALIPWVKEKIAKHYPGTLLAFTEYNHGGGNAISGAIAEADTLGIFGREDVFAAALWPLGGKLDYQYAGLNMFRNYDGKGGAFGDTGLNVSAAADPGKASLYASLDNAGNIVLVAINKTDDKLPLQINIKGAGRRQGTAYYLTGDKAESVRGADPTVKNNTVSVELPALSVATLVLAP